MRRIDATGARSLSDTAMNALRQFQHDRRLLAVLVLLCALFTRLAVPAGFMVGNDAAHGGPVIEICTGQGPMQVAVPGTDAPRHDGDHGHAGNDHPCAFASAAAAVDLTAIVHPAAPVIAAVALPGLALRFARPGLGLAAPPPPKTGPPALR